MSELVQFDIQTEIIKKLPIKSLIRFKSVSKQWKSLIDSSAFIHDNCLRDYQTHHLLVRYYLDSVQKYVSIIDDDSFPQHKSFPTVPVTFKGLDNVFKLSSSHGIICLYVFYRDTNINNETGMIVLWNPTIQKSVVCHNTSDPKLVKIKNIQSSGVSWEVEMFTLSLGVWRSISVAMPSKRPVELSWSQVFINGVINLYGNDKIDAGHENGHNRIISFDLKSEEFGEVLLLDSLVRSTAEDLYLTKVMGSLAVIESFYERPVSVVWKMNEEGVLTKVYTINACDGAFSNRVLEFRKNSEPIMQSLFLDNGGEAGELTILEVYEPCLGRVKDVWPDESRGFLASCTVYSYTETLALLNQSDPIIYS
ncbi:putative F-box protein At4g38870 [Rutidosis leptorrhynchoides]|uniref:putative F-box protein At4g38870 n=1 Tax=Rutidosis leptorrhynchoides TaxID=125765 RepID=UPI003A99E92C